MTGGGGPEPYLGLQPFSTADDVRFFGRPAESYLVSGEWIGNQLVVLHGPAGVGKTSLLNAGVVPEVRDRADVLPIGRLRQRGTFTRADQHEHNPYTYAVLSSWGLGASPEELAGRSVLDVLDRRPPRRDQYGERDEVLVAIDQFEELFLDSPYDGRHRDGFIDALAEAVRKIPWLHLLVSIREDFLAAFLPYERKFAGNAPPRFRLLPLTRPAALDAVRLPLQPTTRSFAAGAAERLVDNLRTTDIKNRFGATSQVVSDRVEPVPLQVVCAAMWRDLPPDMRVITEDHVSGYVRIDEILLASCESAIDDVARRFARSAAEVSGWLERTFITEHGTRDTAYEGLAATAGMPNEVVRALVDGHLLASELRSGSRWYELQHDRWIEPVRMANRRLSAGRLPGESEGVAYLRAAESALADGDLTLAEKHAAEALRIAGGDAVVQTEARSFLGDLARRQGRQDEALQRYREAADLLEPLDQHSAGRLLAEVARLLQSLGRPQEALDQWQRAAQRRPEDPDVQLGLAGALERRQPGGALGIYEQVLSIAPGEPRALRGRGLLLADLGRPQAALADLDELARRRPDQAGEPDVRAARALALAGLGRTDDAAREAAAAVEAAPASGPVLFRAAKVALAAGDPEQAAALGRHALAAGDPALLPHQADEVRRLLP